MTSIIRNRDVVLIDTPDSGKIIVSTPDENSVSINTNVVSFPEYTGEYDVIPTRQKRVLNTANKVLGSNVVIEPIPNNYGLVEYNGRYIRIS